MDITRKFSVFMNIRSKAAVRMRLIVLLIGPVVFGQNAPAPAPYILGPDDQVVIRVLDSDDVGPGPFRIDKRGYINVPLAGHIQAAGLAVDDLEAAIAARLKDYLQNPVVTVSISEFRSQPVSVLGAVNTPGVHQIRGSKTLFESISEAGGLKTEAGDSIRLTRRKEFGEIPLSGARLDSTAQYFVAEVTVKSVIEGRSPQENIQVKPYDVISVPRAEMVFVIGCVKRPGAFVLSERKDMSVLQALSMAEGLDRLAAPSNAKVLRTTDTGTSRTEIEVDVKKILSGKSPDIKMVANDILFIPNGAAKSAGMRAMEAAIQLGTGVAIYRR
jgi:polysaccharide export outer membrane protein